MPSVIFLHGQKYVIDDLDPIGQGGEGAVYRLRDSAIKVFHGYEFLYSNPTILSQDAKKSLENLLEIQPKMVNIPPKIPPRVVQPSDLVFDEKRKLIVGYTMRYQDGVSLLRFINNNPFRKKFQSAFLKEILVDLHSLVKTLHLLKIVIGDFRAENIIVDISGKTPKCFLVDFDSMSWGNFQNTAFNWDCADPLLLGSDKQGGVKMVKKYSEISDWYSFSVISMQLLTRVGPYGGPIADVARKRWKINSPEMPLHRLTIFHPDVLYPKSAVPLKFFPRELVNYWRDVFNKDQRGIFPIQKLITLNWINTPIV